MRQYVSADNPDRNGLLFVTGKDYRYFRQVLRICVGDMVDVRFASGLLQGMTVCRVDENIHQIVLQKCTKSESDAAQSAYSVDRQIDFWLFQFIPKNTKMDLIVRQATECGVSTIVPVIGSYSQGGTIDRNFRSERFDRIIREARQQCGSSVATRITQTVSVSGAIQLWKDTMEKHSLGIVLYERSDQTESLYDVVRQETSVCAASIVVGSEGGISPDEIELFRSGGFKPVHLKTNILRCETAALYGLAALQSAVAENEICR